MRGISGKPIYPKQKQYPINNQCSYTYIWHRWIHFLSKYLLTVSEFLFPPAVDGDSPVQAELSGVPIPGLWGRISA